MRAKDVEGILERLQRGELQGRRDVTRVRRECGRRGLTNLFETREYTSGDWYIRLFRMKYTASGRTV